MSMKPFLPFVAASFLFISACGLEKPPASLELPSKEKEATTEAAPAPAAPAAAPGDPLAAGKTVYEGGCAGCHDAGMMGAPKPGDKVAWKDRLPQGVEAMAKKSIEGFQGKAGMMPAKGGNASLTDEEVTNAVAYMADLSK